jgi:hypothetical protein
MWKLGLRPHNSFSGNTQMGFSLQCSHFLRCTTCSRLCISLLFSLHIIKQINVFCLNSPNCSVVVAAGSIENDLLKVNVYFTSLNVNKITEKPRYSVSANICQMKRRHLTSPFSSGRGFKPHLCHWWLPFHLPGILSRDDF